MKIKQLNIHHLRNLANEKIQFSPSFNFIMGDNGSGKTSVLEAMYLLSTGHSFRTRETGPLIQKNHSEFTLFAQSFEKDSISISKSMNGQTLAKINHTPCKTSSEMAHFMPCQIFYQDIFHIIDAGPSVRRSVLDWGMFHVEPQYIQLWKNLKRIVKQRNALLKQRSNREAFFAWDKQLCECSYALHDQRKKYVQNLAEQFKQIISQICDIDASIEYYKGWNKAGEDSLEQSLRDKYASDLQRQYTQVGAHQADLIIKPSNNAKAKHIFSRGQQKMILIALKLAQTKLIGRSCIYLFDDLSSELDNRHIEHIVNYLKNETGQYFITSTDRNAFLQKHFDQSKHFLMENGQLRSI